MEVEDSENYIGYVTGEIKKHEEDDDNIKVLKIDKEDDVYLVLENVVNVPIKEITNSNGVNIKDKDKRVVKDLDDNINKEVNVEVEVKVVYKDIKKMLVN